MTVRVKPGRHRPYFKKRIEELEALLALHGRDTSKLQSLEDELRHRKTQRAVALLRLVRKKLGVAPRMNGNERRPGRERKQRQTSDRQRDNKFSQAELEMTAVRLEDQAAGHGRSLEAVMRSTERVVTSRQTTPAFFDVQPRPGVLEIALNMSHPAAQYLLTLLPKERGDMTRDELVEQATNLAMALRVMIHAWARLEAEQSGRSRRMIRDARLEWGRYGEELFDGVRGLVADEERVVASASTQEGRW